MAVEHIVEKKRGQRIQTYKTVQCTLRRQKEVDQMHLAKLNRRGAKGKGSKEGRTTKPRG